MRTVLLTISMLLVSLNTFAFSTITLERDIDFSEAYDDGHNFYTETFEPGHTFSTSEVAQMQTPNMKCHAIFHSPSNTEIAEAGTEFEVVSIERNGCSFHYELGRACRLEIKARSEDRNLRMNFICIKDGLFSSKISLKEANRSSKGLVKIE